MANRFARGRPMVALVSSADERSYLERQIRRQRVARSFTERCRINLACAAGEPSKVVAERLGICIQRSADEVLSAVKRFCQKTEKTLCDGL